MHFFAHDAILDDSLDAIDAVNFLTRVELEGVKRIFGTDALLPTDRALFVWSICT